MRAHTGSEAMKTGMALTKATPAVEAGLGVVALGLLGADREVGDEDVGPGVAQDAAATSTGSAGDSSTVSA